MYFSISSTPALMLPPVMSSPPPGSCMWSCGQSNGTAIRRWVSLLASTDCAIEVSKSPLGRQSSPFSCTPASGPSCPLVTPPASHAFCVAIPRHMPHKVQRGGLGLQQLYRPLMRRAFDHHCTCDQTRCKQPKSKLTPLSVWPQAPSDHGECRHGKS